MERKKRINWTPYLLLLPTVLYLLIFFAWPMAKAFQLAVRGGGDALLEIRAERDENSDVVGEMLVQTPLQVVEHQRVIIRETSFSEEDERWFKVTGDDKDGNPITGWATQNQLRLDGPTRLEGEQRRRTLIIPPEGDTLNLYIEPDFSSAIAGEVAADETANPIGYTQVVTDAGYDVEWVQIRLPDLNDETIEGWTPISTLGLGHRTVVGAETLQFSPLDAIQLPAAGEIPQIPMFTEPNPDSEVAGVVAPRSIVTLIGRQLLIDEENRRVDDWYRVTMDGVEGWLPISALDLGYGVSRSSTVTQQSSYTVYSIPTIDPDVEIGSLVPDTAITLSAYGLTLDGLPTSAWNYVTFVNADGETVSGWVRRDNIDYEHGGTRPGLSAVVSSGTTSESSFTLSNIKRMVNHNRFWEAFRTTFILIIIILPIQFTLAIIMALLLQARLKGGTVFLYIYAIPLGVSDLATGLIWYSIFTQSGYINAFLRSLGLIDQNYVFLSAENRHWMIAAVVLAEVWRATSIVMVIVVSGLQAIPEELIEAGEVFGANLWQRIRYIILPLLKPSLQVALILRTILAFQVFAVILAITGQGLTVLSAEAYSWYSVRSREEVAAAYAGLIMLLSLGISMFYLRAVRTQEEVANS